MNGSENKNFLAVYVSKSLIDGKEPYYQEGFALIKASSLEEAKQKAPQLLDDVNTSYENVDGENVTWNLETLNIVPTLDNVNDNYEVIDLYVRGFEDFQAYQKLYKSK